MVYLPTSKLDFCDKLSCSDSHPQAKWISTMHSAAAFIAWETEMAVTKLMPLQPSFPVGRYRPDVLHNWHVVLLPLCDGSSVVKKFEEMTRLWRSYCDQARMMKRARVMKKKRTKTSASAAVRWRSMSQSIQSHSAQSRDMLSQGRTDHSTGPE